MGSESLFSFARSAAAMATLVGLSACATPTPPSMAQPTPTVENTPSTTILISEQGETISIPGCEAMPFDGSSRGGHREWRHMRGVLGESERRLDVTVLAKSCNSKSPNSVGVVRARHMSWVSDEWALVFERSNGGRPASIRRVDRWWDGTTKGAENHPQEATLNGYAEAALMTKLDALQIRRFPSDVPGPLVYDSPAFFIESCLDGVYRMTRASCMFENSNSPFTRTQMALDEAAQSAGLHPQAAPEE